MTVNRPTVVALILVVISTGFVCGQEASEPPKTAAKEPAIDIAQLIKQLDAEEFSERQAASAKLAEAGESAIPALEKAATGDSREAAMRAFEILKGHFDKSATPVKDAAKQALERLSKSDSGAASRRATEALTPPNPANPPGVRGAFAPGVPGGIRIGRARIVIAAGAGGGGTETKIRIEDGVKTTEVKDKDRKVKIVDDPAKGLQLEVTETKDGKEETKKYEAKNAEELKTKNAEAHKIYEEYSAKGGEIKIGGFGAIPGIPGVPLPIAPVRPALPPRIAIPEVPPVPTPPTPIEPAKKIEGLEALEKAIQQAEASLKEAIKQSGDSEQLKQAQQRLDEVRKQLEQLRDAKK